MRTDKQYKINLKYVILFFSFTIFITSFSQKVNTKFYFRPFHLGQSNNEHKFKNNYEFLIDRNYYMGEVLLNIEIHKENVFFHFPVLGYSFYNSKQLVNSYKNDTLYAIKNEYSAYNEYYAGYGIGKEFYLSKIFMLNFKSFITGGVRLWDNDSNTDYFKNNGDLQATLKQKSKIPIKYEFKLELNPSLVYKHKKFLFSLGVPISFNVETYDGKIITKASLENYITNKTTNKEVQEKYSATNFHMRYNIELGLGFQFNSKKELQKLNKEELQNF